VRPGYAVILRQIQGFLEVNQQDVPNLSRQACEADRWRIARAIKNAAKRKPGGIFMLAPKDT
jgi:hypothetical protein